MELYRFIDLNKAAIDERHPFDGEMLLQIKDYYRIELTWSSNALEGNSFTKSETKVVLEDELSIGAKPLNYLLEVVGHGKAYDFMFTLLENRAITESDILTIHQLFYKSIESEYAGKYRDMDVFISGSAYPVTEAKRIQVEMDGLFHWMSTQRDQVHPVKFAAQLHKRFASICPFKDGNGRIARLMMNTALMQDGYLPAVIPPALKPEYIEFLEKAQSDDKPFEQFIAERVIESQKEVMGLLHIPMPKADSDMDKSSIVKEWLDFADKEINSAKHFLSMCPIPLEIICYHCEQAAEKVLKGYLIHQDMEPLWTHDLKLLYKMCVDIDKTFEEISQPCFNLTAYSEQITYPFELEVSDSDMQKAITNADRVLDFVFQKLQLVEEIAQDDDEQKDQQENAGGQQLT